MLRAQRGSAASSWQVESAAEAGAGRTARETTIRVMAAATMAKLCCLRVTATVSPYQPPVKAVAVGM